MSELMLVLLTENSADSCYGVYVAVQDVLPRDWSRHRIEAGGRTRQQAVTFNFSPDTSASLKAERRCRLVEFIEAQIVMICSVQNANALPRTWSQKLISMCDKFFYVLTVYWYLFVCGKHFKLIILSW